MGRNYDQMHIVLMVSEENGGKLHLQ
jgi:hypothetical protein